MATLVDTNILIDIVEIGGAWEAWSTRTLVASRARGRILINQIIFAEIAAGFIREADLDAVFPASKFEREELPWEAAFLAGRAFAAYRSTGGVKRSPLPDFYIGAHALVARHTLLTREAPRYRSYFPTLDIISPDTHP